MEALSRWPHLVGGLKPVNEAATPYRDLMLAQPDSQLRFRPQRRGEGVLENKQLEKPNGT